jgi:hypothetical protein
VLSKASSSSAESEKNMAMGQKARGEFSRERNIWVIGLIVLAMTSEDITK